MRAQPAISSRLPEDAQRAQQAASAGNALDAALQVDSDHVRDAVALSNTEAGSVGDPRHEELSAGAHCSSVQCSDRGGTPDWLSVVDQSSPQDVLRTTTWSILRTSPSALTISAATRAQPPCA